MRPLVQVPIVLAILLIGCGGAVDVPRDAGDAGAAEAAAPDAPPASWCDVALNDAGAAYGLQCGAEGVYWTWTDARGEHPCTEVCAKGDACAYVGDAGQVTGTCE